MQEFRLIYLVKQELVVELLYLSPYSLAFLLLRRPIIEKKAVSAIPAGLICETRYTHCC